MKKQIMMLLVLVTMVIAGCAEQRYLDPSKRLALEIDKVHSDKAVVTSVVGYEYFDDYEQTFIAGKVARWHTECCDVIHGSVQIELIDLETGDVVDTQHLSVSPRAIPDGGSKSSTFMGRLPYVVPQDCDYQFKLIVTFVEE